MGRERNKKLYDREFKLNALKLLEKGEVSMTQLAKDLGVNHSFELAEAVREECGEGI